MSSSTNTPAVRPTTDQPEATMSATTTAFTPMPAASMGSGCTRRHGRVNAIAATSTISSQRRSMSERSRPSSTATTTTRATSTQSRGSGPGASGTRGADHTARSQRRITPPL